MDRTTVQVDKKTLDRLYDAKTRDESYDEFINRLLDEGGYDD